MDMYVRVNTAFIPVQQLRLPRVLEETAPKFELTGLPSRTLTQVFQEDFVPTVDLIRRIYIPFYDPGDCYVLETATGWVKNNRKEFDEEWNTKGGMSKLPLEVLFFYHTLSFMTAFGDGIGAKNAKEFRVPVAFEPKYPDFKKDVHRLTLPQYDNFQGRILAMGKAANFSEATSSSKFCYLITRLLWSGGDDEYALEAADILTRCLFLSYFVSLKDRFYRVSRYYR